MVILYSFYKNITMVFTLFYFNFYNMFTGQTLYESFLGTMWNVLFTLVPIILYGVLEQDISAETAQKYPRSYKSGQEKRGFNVEKMVLWVLNAMYHSFVAYFLSRGIMSMSNQAGELSQVKKKINRSSLPP